MNCEHARLTFLDSFTGPIDLGVRLPMEDHIASCEACRQFAEMQRSLDARLTAAVSAVSLSPRFRNSLRARLNHRPTPAWPDHLPDIAHLGGCALAMVLLLVAIPQYSRTVLLAGSGFTAVTYFFQAVLRSSLERLEHNL